MVHNVKTLTKYFNESINGIKTFSVRFNDRNYKVGDILTKLEIDENKNFTGRSADFKIVYILENADFALKQGYIILGLKQIN